MFIINPPKQRSLYVTSPSLSAGWVAIFPLNVVKTRVQGSLTSLGTSSPVIPSAFVDVSPNTLSTTPLLLGQEPLASRHVNTYRTILPTIIVRHPVLVFRIFQYIDNDYKAMEIGSRLNNEYLAPCMLYLLFRYVPSFEFLHFVNAASTSPACSYTSSEPYLTSAKKDSLAWSIDFGSALQFAPKVHR